MGEVISNIEHRILNGEVEIAAHSTVLRAGFLAMTAGGWESDLRLQISDFILRGGGDVIGTIGVVGAVAGVKVRVKRM